MLVGTGLLGKRHVLLHCAGAAAAERGARPREADRSAASARCIRCQAIADGRTAMRALKGTVFGIEGDEVGRATASEARRRARRHRARARQLADGRVSRGRRARVELRRQRDRCRGRRCSRVRACHLQQAAQALVPLAQGALAQRRAKGTTEGLTGPVRRGDAETIQRHLDALRGKPDLVEIYRALARRAVEIAARIDGPDAPDRKGLAAIRTLLGS